MTSQTEITNSERIRILRELGSCKCFCGARKVANQTFCKLHYHSLPLAIRDDLYNRFGHGYEEAYTEAREYIAKADVA